MRGNRILIIGLMAAGSVSLSAAGQQPDDASQRAATKALEQLVQLAHDGSKATVAAPDRLATQQAASLEAGGETSDPRRGAGNQAGRQAPELQRRFPRYRVERGDTLAVQFSFVPEFNQSLAVQPDGFVNLREVGDLHVEGLTTDEIAAKVREAYSKILNDPVTSVSLTDFEKPYFIVGGQVARPGKFDLRGDTTVAQAIQIGGGFTEKSKHSQVLLFRKVSNGWVEARTLDMKGMLRAGNLSEDLYLQPGDMIFVPQNKLSKIQPFLPLPHPGIIVNPSSF